MNSSPNQFSQSPNTPDPTQSQPPEPVQSSESESPPTHAPAEPTSGNHAATNAEGTTETDTATQAEVQDMRQQPIPPPSEPRQYRAIGLVEGRYQPSDEQFTRGNLVTQDGTLIDAVLLGKVMSLVKNHLNLEEDHLWVVYPRTRQKEQNLHAQIMGVWEPEKLSTAVEKFASGDRPSASATSTPESATPPSPETSEESVIAEAMSPNMPEGYFSVRGEVVYQSQDQEYIVVKIKQSRKDSPKAKFFKLQLQGTLPGKAVGHFWDLHVERQGDILKITQGNDMGMIPSKRNKFSSRKPKGKKYSNRPNRSGKPPSYSSSSRSGSACAPVKRSKPKPKEEG